MEDQMGLYEQHDPDPPAPVDAETTPQEPQEEPKKRGRPRTRTPEEAVEAKREADRKRRKAKGPPTPAPEVAASGAERSPGEAVALTMADLTEEQRKSREVALSFLGHGWSDLTKRLLGVALVVPEGASARKEFDALIAVRPDIGAAAGAWEGWVTAFDALAVKRGWYRAISAEAAFILATIGLAGTVGAVYMGNVRAERAQKAAQAARAEQAAQAAQAERAAQAEQTQTEPTA